jgi:hypothetical protein
MVIFSSVRIVSLGGNPTEFYPEPGKILFRVDGLANSKKVPAPLAGV